MLCCVCKENKATMHLTRIVEGKMQKVNAFEECAGKMGLDPAGFLLGQGKLPKTE